LPNPNFNILQPTVPIIDSIEVTLNELTMINWQKINLSMSIDKAWRINLSYYNSDTNVKTILYWKAENLQSLIYIKSIYCLDILIGTS
jgi:hypothetical protein